MWRRIRHLALRQYNAQVLPVARRINARVNRRKVKAEIQMLENLWERGAGPDPTEPSRRLDSVARWVVTMGGRIAPVDFFFPGARAEAEAEKHRKEMKALESLWPTNDDHMFEEHSKRDSEYREPYEEAKVPTEGQEPIPASWVIPHDFHTRAAGCGTRVKVTKDLDTWEYHRILQRHVRSRLGNG